MPQMQLLSADIVVNEPMCEAFTSQLKLRTERLGDEVNSLAKAAESAKVQFLDLVETKVIKVSNAEDKIAKKSE